MRWFLIVGLLLWAPSASASTYDYGRSSYAWAQAQPLSTAEEDRLYQELYENIAKNIDPNASRDENVTTIKTIIDQLINKSYALPSVRNFYTNLNSALSSTIENEVFPSQLKLLTPDFMSKQALKDYKEGKHVNDNYLQDLERSPETVVNPAHLFNWIMKRLVKRKGYCSGRTKCRQYDIGVIDRALKTLENIGPEKNEEAIRLLSSLKETIITSEQAEQPLITLVKIYAMMSEEARRHLESRMSGAEYAPQKVVERLRNETKLQTALLTSLRFPEKISIFSPVDIKSATELVQYRMKQRNDALHRLYLGVLGILKQCINRPRNECIEDIQGMATQYKELHPSDAEGKVYATFLTDIGPTIQAQVFPVHLYALRKLSPEGFKNYREGGMRVDDKFLEGLAPENLDNPDYIWNLLVQKLSAHNCQGRAQCLQQDQGIISGYIKYLQAIKKSPVARKLASALQSLNQQTADDEQSEPPTSLLQAIEDRMSFDLRKQMHNARLTGTGEFQGVPIAVRLTGDEQFAAQLQGGAKTIQVVNPATRRGKALEKTIDKSVDRVRGALFGKLKSALPEGSKPVAKPLFDFFEKFTSGETDQE